MGADNSQDFILGNEFGIYFYRRLGFGFVVLDDQLNFIFFVADNNSAGRIDILQPHLGGEFGALAHLGYIAGKRRVDSDLNDVSFIRAACMEYRYCDKTQANRYR